MYIFNRDEELLSKQVANACLNATMSSNSQMALASNNSGCYEDLLSSIKFIELCKKKVSEILDNKIEELEKRVNELKGYK